MEKAQDPLQNQKIQGFSWTEKSRSCACKKLFLSKLVFYLGLAMLHWDTQGMRRDGLGVSQPDDCHPKESQLGKPWCDVTGASDGMDASDFWFLFPSQIQHFHL